MTVRLLHAPVLVLRILALLAAAGALLWPVAASYVPSTASAEPDPVVITDYRADYRVGADGELVAEETITADFPDGRHGIFRYWDVTLADSPRVRLQPHDIEVTRDGADEETDLLWEAGRRYRVARIGDADTFVDRGLHTYVIRYRIPGALKPTADGHSVFRWQVVAGGWRMAMFKTKTTVQLPADATGATCEAEPEAGCRVKVDGSLVVVRTGQITPFTPIVLDAPQAIAAPAQVTVPWPVRYDGVLGSDATVATGLGGLAVVALAAAGVAAAGTRERRPAFPVLFEPPAGMGPAQASFVMDERVHRRAIVASLMQAATHGLVRLEQQKKKRWLIQGLGGDWDRLDELTRFVGSELGLREPGSQFRSDGSVDAGRRLAAVQSELPDRAQHWAAVAGLLAPSRRGRVGLAALAVAAVVAAALLWWRPGGMTLWALPAVAFVLGGLGFVRGETRTRRTAEGREAWSRAGGFRRMLSTPSAQDRFDFSARRELYTAYIPYAVAFDCAEEWARKYHVETGEEPPAPAWFAGHDSRSVQATTHGDFGSFESSLGSSISAYESYQSSQSSGGSSGGGGGSSGGGGGGGSW